MAGIKFLGVVTPLWQVPFFPMPVRLTLIKAGETAEIKVRYRASSKTAALDLKHVTVLANTKPDFTNLYLKANVVL
jgi:hypothetical protein